VPPTAYLKVPYFCSGCRRSKVGFTMSPASKRASRRRLDCSRQRGPRWPITRPSHSRGGGPLPLEDPRRSPRWALGALRLWCPRLKADGRRRWLLWKNEIAAGDPSVFVLFHPDHQSTTSRPLHRPPPLPPNNPPIRPTRPPSRLLEVFSTVTTQLPRQ
jgi:hypothetical protein